MCILSKYNRQVSIDEYKNSYTSTELDVDIYKNGIEFTLTSKGEEKKLIFLLIYFFKTDRKKHFCWYV